MRSAPAQAPADQARTIECVRAFEAHFGYLYRALRRYGVRPGDTDDLAQDVFVAMWRSWHLFDRQRPLQPWLAGIAFRVARNHLRRKWREVPDADLETADGAALGDERVASAQSHALVMQALGQMPEKYRLPLVLHEIDEMPVNEVASLLRLPRATTYTRLRRARLAFAKLVEELNQRDAARSALLLLPGNLLGAERTPPAPPALAQQKASAFARSFESGRTVPLPRATPARWFVPQGLRLPLLALGLGLAGTLVFLAVRPAPPPPVQATTSLAREEAAPARRLRQDRRLGAPSFITALPAALPPRAPAPEPLPTAGLAGLWSFDEPASDLLAADQSGQQRDCLLHETEKRSQRLWVDSPRGRAADLRLQGWLECPMPEVSTGGPLAMTVSAWVKMRSLPDLNTAIATRQIESSYKDLFYFGFASNHRLRVSSHAWDGVAEASAPAERGRWYHAAFTHAEDGVTVLYLDGEEVARARGAHHAQGRVTAPLTIGAGQFDILPNRVRQRLDGMVDEVRVYDRALSPAEIRALASQPAE